MTQALYPDFPTRKVINYFDMAKGFTFFNSYLTYVKIEKKLGKYLFISKNIITLYNVNNKQIKIWIMKQ